MELKNKKVLLMGLGILGGGVATAKWLLEQGADLTITDLKDEEHLSPSLEKLSEFKDKIKYVIGRHEEKDFLENEIIVINPDIPVKNKFVELARKNNKQIENELTLFCRFCPSKKIVAITGTRGKTTTVNWIYHILKSQNANTILAGNSSENTFLGMLKECDEESIVVLEVPSYHLELDNNIFKPHVAVITNIYQDHLNRHGTLEEYARTKANIFKNQTEGDFLILDKNNEWTDFLLDLKSRAKVSFFYPDKNSPNLAASLLVAKIIGVSEKEIAKAIPTLPQIKFRQEKVFENDKLEIYNDTAATSPEATMAILDRFKNHSINVILISGGTDRELDFTGWADQVKKWVVPENLVLLSGSATEKMKKELSWKNFQEFENLKECIDKALEIVSKNKGKSVILFSPSSKSFEKFKNEFDRGEKFNRIVSEVFGVSS